MIERCLRPRTNHHRAMRPREWRIFVQEGKRRSMVCVKCPMNFHKDFDDYHKLFAECSSSSEFRWRNNERYRNAWRLKRISEEYYVHWIDVGSRRPNSPRLSFNRAESIKSVGDDRPDCYRLKLFSCLMKCEACLSNWETCHGNA